MALSSLLLSPSVRAQEEPHRTSYEGVSPGTSHAPPAAGRIVRRGRRGGRSEILTWPGFQPLAGGGSRFFVQTTAAVSTDVRVAPERVEVLFRHTTLHLANSRLWLETAFFNTPVLRARLERRGRDTVLVLWMRAASTPQVSQSGEGGELPFVFVDFPAGEFLPPPASGPGAGAADSGAPASAARPGGADAAQPASPAPVSHSDDERPPTLRRGD